MPKTPLWRYSCDLCGKVAQSETTEPPTGWIEWSYEVAERDFAQRAVCPACVKEIDYAKSRATSAAAVKKASHG